ncbi:PspC domain-containing protein [Sinomonas mesophila]|uniref:PspC domain-containing protein n=1 Tax=Sinomonas mesophila TaxID=1531955 RepID=UPI00098794FC|nr:PspC domain-containing protein [Sinomonas mesophila]
MDTFFNAIRSSGLRRGPRRLLGGVLAGLAAKANVDVAFVRIGFLLLCLLPGPAVLAYLAAWILIPNQDGRIILEDVLRRRSLGRGPSDPQGPKGPAV